MQMLDNYFVPYKKFVNCKYLLYISVVHVSPSNSFYQLLTKDFNLKSEENCENT